MKRIAILALAGLAACMPASTEAPPTRAALATIQLPPMKTFGSSQNAGPTRPNGEITRDILDLTFQLESGRTLGVLSRFEGPISVRLTGQAPATMQRDLSLLIGRLQVEAGLPIQQTSNAGASITVEAISRGDLQRAFPGAACFVIPNVSSWSEYRQQRNTASVDWATVTQRRKVAVFIPYDVAPQEARACLHEELSQAIGPLNDLYRLPDSVYNDDDMHTVLTSFDMLVLRALYSRDLSSGMTRSAVAARLPAILARLNPAGQRAGMYSSQTSNAWKDAIQMALSPSSGDTQRRNAANQAIAISNATGLSGAPQGFGLLTFGRLQFAHDPEQALGALQAADRIFRSTSETQPHRAHVAVNLAAYTLSTGNGTGTLAIVGEAIPIAARHENAALLATLLMFKAEALSLLGRSVEAQAVRLDSLGWARYGFGSETNIRARLSEVAALNPARES